MVATVSQYVTGPLTVDMSGKYTCMAFNNVTGRNTTAYTMLTVYGKLFALLFMFILRLLLILR